MKNVLLLFFLSTLSCTYAQYWATTGATWHFERIYYMPMTVETGFVKIESVGDTLIDGITCQKLLVQDPMFCHGRPEMEFTYYSNDTVYYYDTTYSNFHVLYDFGAEQGDSWETVVTMFGAEHDTITTTVDSTDIVAINGQNLKRLYVTYSVDFSFQSDFQYSSVIIERIGDLQYMFNIMPGFYYSCDESYSGGLRCYEDGILGSYETGIAPSCEHEAYVGLDENNQSQVNIFPNPSTDDIHITGVINNNLKVTLTNSEGRIVLISKGTDVIDVSNLESGIYFLTIQAVDELTQRKIMVSNTKYSKQ